MRVCVGMVCCIASSLTHLVTLARRTQIQAKHHHTNNRGNIHIGSASIVESSLFFPSSSSSSMFTPGPALSFSGASSRPSHSPVATPMPITNMAGGPNAALFGSPVLPHTSIGGLDSSHPFAFPACSFGTGMFAESGMHFPTAVAQLYETGFARSAGILLECGLSFYGQAMHQTRQNTPEWKPYKPAPGDAAAIPSPAAMALFGQCCLSQGEYKRAVQYMKTALSELAKLKRSAVYASNTQIRDMNILNSPEREWTITLIDALLAVHDDATAQKHLEAMYNFSLSNTHLPGLPVKYLLTLARMYATPPAPASASVTQNYLVHNPKAAIGIHTKLIQLHPLAIESALELIKLGVDPRPLLAQSFAHHHAAPGAVVSLPQQCMFLHLFLTIILHAHQGKYAEALAIEEGGLGFLTSVVPRSTMLLEVKAQVQVAFSDTDMAAKTLERLHTIDPYSVSSMDLLGLLYGRRGSSKELATLMAHTLRVDESRQEAWVIASCSSAITGAKEKAQKHMEKALVMQQNHMHIVATRDLSPFSLSIPLTAKGYQYLEWEQSAVNEKRLANLPLATSGQLEHAIAAFRKALLIHPNNSLATFGLAKSLVLHATISTSAAPSTIGSHPSFKNALHLVSTPASLAENQKNPRILTNYGIILSQHPEGRQKAAKLLHRAIQIESDFPDAVLALADMYCASEQYQDALHMLLVYTKKVAAYLASGGSASVASVMLGSRDYFLVKIGQIHAFKGELIEAMRFYRQAIAINPNCTAAQDAMNKLEQDAKDALDAEMQPEEA